MPSLTFHAAFSSPNVSMRLFSYDSLARTWPARCSPHERPFSASECTCEGSSGEEASTLATELPPRKDDSAELAVEKKRLAMPGPPTGVEEAEVALELSPARGLEAAAG